MTFTHPVLGQSRPDGEYPKRCSKCGDPIPEEEVPLMLFAEAEGQTLLFCYHSRVECEGVAWPFLAAARMQRETDHAER